MMCNILQTSHQPIQLRKRIKIKKSKRMSSKVNKMTVKIDSSSRCTTLTRKQMLEDINHRSLYFNYEITQFNFEFLLITFKYKRVRLQLKTQEQVLSKNMKEGSCRQHKNPADLICLHDQCQQRLMCMLCEHNHQFFTSVRAKLQVNWKFFKKKVDQSIDLSMKVIDNIEQGGIQEQKKIVIQYYNSIRESLNKFLDLRMNQNLGLFNSSKNSDTQFLIRARIQGKYNQLPLELFKKIKQVYEGKDLQSLARQQRQLNLQNAYNYMKQFHQQMESLLSRFKIELKTKIPEIRIKSELNNFNLVHVESYDQIIRTKQKQKVKYESNVQIQSMISDAYSGKKQIMTVGFDKTLRIFDKNIKLICSKQFNNIITRIEPIGDNFFAIAVSKQLHINKVTHEEAYDPKHILTLKGHTQRIWDVSSFNTRIVGSCSEEGTKIWDLYKQRCQYTLRQQINPSCMKFMRLSNMLAVGYYNHVVKIYSITNMKPTKFYQMPGTPLIISQENRNQNLLYVGGFDSDLWLFDVRVAKQVFNHNFKSQAVTCFKQSLFQQETMMIGQRGGKVRIFDLRKIKTRLQWAAHSKVTNLSRPNGVIRVFQQGQNEILTVGSNDRKAIIWQLQDAD